MNAMNAQMNAMNEWMWMHKWMQIMNECDECYLWMNAMNAQMNECNEWILLVNCFCK